MKNSLGQNVTFTLFGESHGPYIGGVLDGLPAGIPIDESRIKAALARRRPKGDISTPRVEEDPFQIISGTYNGFSTGEPLTLLIPNSNTHSSHYPEGLVRPGHCDFVSHEVSDGFNDPRGGGHFSGRLTAVIVALGAICLGALETKGIHIASHAYRIGNVFDHKFKDVAQEISLLKQKDFPVIANVEEDMKKEILVTREECDSIGGITETAIIGLPLGVGDPWFASLEGVIANAMFGLGGVKGIEFGSGFDFASMKGSEANDAFVYEEGKARTLTNHNGGINGGISNGMPVLFSLAIKPVSSIAKKQKTINYATKENVELELEGRHDPCIVHRICPVIDALTGIVLMDELVRAFGKSFFKK